MIVVIKKDANEQNLNQLLEWLKNQDLDVHISKGEFHTILGLIGDVGKVDIHMLDGLSIVERVQRISEPYKNANRKFHSEDMIINVCGRKIGGGNFALIAGPCSVESEEQICEIADDVLVAGANFLRGGAFKPRTSPYAFQGMGGEGIELLLKAKEKTGLPIVSEIMNPAHLDYFEHIDVLQVGARNMQNFDLLKELGMLRKPILIKRGLSNTLEELLMSAEYVMANGNEEVILCERGIRTFETATRNTLDIGAIPKLKQMTHLPIVVDPSHATGQSSLVHPLSLAAAAAGADGLMIEVHNNPAKALCDGPQSLTPEQFAVVARDVRKVLEVISS